MRRLTPGPLVVATHNRGKYEEFKELLAPKGFAISYNADHGLPEPEETEDSFAGNARIKALAAATALGVPALADDSGIAVEALGGAPGIYTADWAETPNGRDFTMAMERTWRECLASGSDQPFRAAFCCVLALAWPDGETQIFEGKMPGTLVWPLRGALGHGYDPMFQPEGFKQTFAEMSAAQKNAISHRGQAVAAFVEAQLG